MHISESRLLRYHYTFPKDPDSDLLHLAICRRAVFFHEMHKSLSIPLISVLCTLALSMAEHDDYIASDLFQSILRDEAVSRLHHLGQVSDANGYLERTFMSPSSMKAALLIQDWMKDAGLRTWMDAMGNVHGRADGANPQAKKILIGSHYDTVIDAGKFDGLLGIIVAISALKVLKTNGILHKLQQPVEVIAFSDEEGVRFQTTYLGSAAVSGTLPVTFLNNTDKNNVTVIDALKSNSIEISEERLRETKYDAESVSSYVEVHIEQGPVLEYLGLPLGVVKGIAGQTRLKVTVRGTQGHAGTVPMKLRQDPMAAAAEIIVFLERLCKFPKQVLSYNEDCDKRRMESLESSLVCTVGEIGTWPSASNVIPGEVSFTVDLRAMEDAGREEVLYELMNRMSEICDARSVACDVERKHDANAVECDGEMTGKLMKAANGALRRMTGAHVEDVPVMMSGAGHDAMAMARITKVAMLFVRCRAGVSHSPAEHVLDHDVWASGLALLSFLQTLL